MLFRSMEKDLAHRSLQPSTALAGPSPLGGDRKVTFDIILSLMNNPHLHLLSSGSVVKNLP